MCVCVHSSVSDIPAHCLGPGWGRSGPPGQCSVRSPAPAAPQGGCEQASPPPLFHKSTQTIITTSLKPTQIPHPHALRSIPLSSQASPHTAQACKHILVPAPHTHTHFTVRNKHRPCRLWEGGEGLGVGAGVFPMAARTKGYLTLDRKIVYHLSIHPSIYL